MPIRLLAALAALFVLTPVFAADTTPDEKARIRYARQAADDGDTKAIPELAKYLDDTSLEVRREAVRAIVQLGTRASLDPLVRAAADPDPAVQIAAADGLVNFYLPGYIQGRIGRLTSAVKSRFTDTNTQIIPAYVDVREDVIQALGKLARSGASVEARAVAARSLGILRGKGASDDLVEALRSKDTTLMYESLIAIQKINDRSVAPRVAAYVRDLDPRVQIAAIETVGLLRYQEAVPSLQRAYADARSDKVRQAALGAVAMLPDESSRPLYVEGLRDKNEQVRAAAAEGLGRLGSNADIPVLEQAFNEERKMPARLGAAFALVKLGRTELSEFSPLQYLINTLNSKGYRGVAEPYLVELARDPNVREQLHAALERAGREEKIGLARVLAVSGDERSLQHLERLSKDSEPAVMEAGIAALKDLRARLGR